MLKKITSMGILVGVMMLIATPVFARTAELKEAGVALWVFLVIGATIILLQLIPAGILFLGFVSTATTAIYTKPKKTEEGIVPSLTESAGVKR